MAQFTFYANKPSQNYNKVDMWLLGSVLLLWGLGIFALYVCSQNYALRAFGDSIYFVKRQLITSVLGFVLMFALLAFDIRIIRKCVSIIVIATFVLCLLTFVPGLSVIKNGARRWLRMPGNFIFQPSEFVKFALIMFLANYFDKQEKLIDPDEKTVFPCVIALVLFSGIVFAQKDFSTGAFILLTGILLFFVSGAKLVWILPFTVLAIPAVFLMITLNPFRLQRLIGWIRPDEFSSGINYQSLAAKRAISAGGVWGSGIGEGLTKINSIPMILKPMLLSVFSQVFGTLLTTP